MEVQTTVISKSGLLKVSLGDKVNLEMPLNEAWRFMSMMQAVLSEHHTELALSIAREHLGASKKSKYTFVPYSTFKWMSLTGEGVQLVQYSAFDNVFWLGYSKRDDTVVIQARELDNQQGVSNPGGG